MSQLEEEGANFIPCIVTELIKPTGHMHRVIAHTLCHFPQAVPLPTCCVIAHTLCHCPHGVLLLTRSGIAHMLDTRLDNLSALLHGAQAHTV